MTDDGRRGDRRQEKGDGTQEPPWHLFLSEKQKTNTQVLLEENRDDAPEEHRDDVPMRPPRGCYARDDIGAFFEEVIIFPIRCD
jgi:hypothetical protein